MRILKHRNIIISQIEANIQRQAIIVGHGGFFSYIDCIRRGSSEISIPNNINELHFYSTHGNGIEGGVISHLLDGIPRNPEEVKKTDDKIVNYSIATTGRIPFANRIRTGRRLQRLDVIYAEPNQKNVSISDVFDAIKHHGLHYQKVHACFCRGDMRDD